MRYFSLILFAAVTLMADEPVKVDDLVKEAPPVNDPMVTTLEKAKPEEKTKAETPPQKVYSKNVTSKNITASAKPVKTLEKAPAERQPSGIASLEAVPVPPMGVEPEGYGRRLASGDAEEDLTHYRNLNRRLGIDIGMMVPLNDFNKEFNRAQMIGLHFTWEAIAPFAFTAGIMRAASTHKTDPSSGKLSVTAFSLGAQATFPQGMVLPFLKLSGQFYFNDVSFESTRYPTAGYDTLLTTVGVSAGIGVDFIVGREVSLGVEATYHYPVPKQISTNAGNFDLGSQFGTLAFRVNF